MPDPTLSSLSSKAPTSSQSQQQKSAESSAAGSQKMLSTASRPAPLMMANDGNIPTSATWKTMTPKRERADFDDAPSSDSKAAKKLKRKGGKACVYCRRSHMVCEGGRPCERCVKRDIAHLCRDVTPPSSAKKGDSEPNTEAASSSLPVAAPIIDQQQPLVYDAASSAWPLLPAPAAAAAAAGGSGGAVPIDISTLAPQAGSSAGGWGLAENAEFGILSDMLKTLRVPTLPGGFVDVISQVVRNNNTNSGTSSNTTINNQQPVMTTAQALPANGASSTSATGNGTAVPATDSAAVSSKKNKGKGKQKEPFSTVSRIEQYLLAAADQPDGPRASRLTQVIRAKYEAGLLKPYDYIKGYERMNRWMDSGRAGRVESGSRASSPTKSGDRPGSSAKSNRVAAAPPPSGSSISPESRRRILAALEGFRPRFRRIAKELTDLDLVFVEEANERLMLQYDRALASIHTPSCIWRRTGEIQKANQEFAKLTGIPAPLFRNGQLCVYELMDEDSAVRFWEGYGKVAFEKGQSHMYTYCTLKIPLSLTRQQPSRTVNNTPAQPATLAMSTVPEFNLPQSITMTPMTPTAATGLMAPTALAPEEEYRVIKTCFSITIRRDRYGIPVAIMGQWIPIGQ